MVVRYCVLVLIGLAYLAFLAFARTPAVSDAYRAYFIDRANIDWTHQNGVPYVWGQLIDARLPSRAFEYGWGEPEHFGRWTAARVSTLRLNLADEASQYEGPACITVRGEFVGRSDDRPVTAVTLRAQGEALGTITNRERRKIFGQFPFAATPAEELHLEFTVDEPVIPAETGESGDQRELGLAVFNIWAENVACRHVDPAALEGPNL